MLVEYVKGDNGRLQGVVVATGLGKLGWSSFNDKKETKRFDKQLALEIAVGRAESGKDYDDFIPFKLRQTVYKMEDRAERYYGHGSNVLKFPGA